MEIHDRGRWQNCHLNIRMMQSAEAEALVTTGGSPKSPHPFYAAALGPSTSRPAEPVASLRMTSFDQGKTTTEKLPATTQISSLAGARRFRLRSAMESDPPSISPVASEGRLVAGS